MTMGAEAAVYASQASVSNDLLEDVLPVTVSDYVDLVKIHLLAGSFMYLTIFLLHVCDFFCSQSITISILLNSHMFFLLIVLIFIK